MYLFTHSDEILDVAIANGDDYGLLTMHDAHHLRWLDSSAQCSSS